MQKLRKSKQNNTGVHKTKEPSPVLHTMFTNCLQINFHLRIDFSQKNDSLLTENEKKTAK